MNKYFMVEPIMSRLIITKINMNEIIMVKIIMATNHG
jgi:hypothetical protein